MKKQIWHDYTCVNYLRVVEFIETKSNMVVARGWRVVERGVNCFVGSEFQFGR